MEASTNSKPSEVAKVFQTLKQSGLNQSDIANRFNCSTAKVSRYLKLADLDNEILELVDSGSLSISQALNVKPRAKNKVATVLAKDLQNVLDIVWQKRFLTRDQLAFFMNTNIDKASRCLNKLVDYDYLTVFKEARPHAYKLSHKGTRLLDVSAPRHYMSGPAIHQHLMKNDVEQFFDAKGIDFNWVSRVSCWAQGFNPAQGEYLARIKGGNWLVLIDDYAMPPSRLYKSLFRVQDAHCKNRTKNPDFPEPKWIDICEGCILICTDEKHLSRHKRYQQTDKQKPFDQVDLELRNIHLPPRWEIV